MNHPKVFQKFVVRMQQRGATVAVLVFLVLVSLTLLIAGLNYRLLRQNEMREMHSVVRTIENRVTDIFAYSELAAMTMAQGIIDGEDVPNFDSVAAVLLNTSNYLDAVQMVPNGVIRQVFPYDRHKDVIGYDILADPKVNKEALEAIRTKRMMFAGPITLKQGGVGVLGRLPVYRNGKFWGFSVVLIMLDRLVDNLGIHNEEGSNFYYQLGKVDPNTGEERFFLDPPIQMAESNVFELKVLPESGWRIYVMSSSSQWIWNSTFAVLLIGLLLSVFAALLVRSFLEIGRQLAISNQSLEWQHAEIRDSIVGASYLQRSVLQTEQDVVALFKDSFVLYRPKDAVSGDFFWVHEQEGKKIIAAVDCTGHGVSAALLSMVANQLLHQTVVLENLNSPAAILTRMNELVTTILQSRGKVTSMDGMDMVVCSFEPAKSKLVFAGANRPLFKVNNGELQEYQGNRFAIGGHRFDHQQKVFDEKTLKLAKGVTVYLTSDGYHSQFGGTLGKKLGRRRFREILADTSKKPIKEQRHYLSRTLEDWAGRNGQVDDILVIGIAFLS